MGTMVNRGAVQALETFHLGGIWFPGPVMVNRGAVQALRYLWDVNLLDWIPATT